MEDYPRIYLYRRVVQAKLFIDRHYAEQIDLTRVADEACFSKYHFIRLFKSIYGMAPHQYRNSVRIRKAMDLLRDGMPVGDVCFAVGFESTTSFSGLFKRATGQSPSAYLLEQRKLSEAKRERPLTFIPGCHLVHYAGEVIPEEIAK